MHNLAVALRAHPGAEAPVRPAPRLLPLDALRTFLTLLVVAHHAALAYHPYAPPPSGALGDVPLLWTAFPVVDRLRAPGLDLLVGFNDLFFMALLFLLSGLFGWPSLERKGTRAFLRDRARRLLLPFAASALLAPLAYYPAFLQRNPAGGVAEFARQWLQLSVWPAGPAWFLWVLFAFDALLCLLPGLPRALARVVGSLGERPGRFALALVVLSICVYLPLAHFVRPESWFSAGPFFVQTSRIGHYALYFFLGAALSRAGTERGLFGGALERRWLRFTFAALGAFAVAVALFLAALANGIEKPRWQAIADLGLPLSCAFSSLAALALSLRFAKRGGPLAALSANAFGLYLLHYPFVSWLQYLLLPVGAPGALKAAAVFVLSSVLGLAATAAMRRIPALRRTL